MKKLVFASLLALPLASVPAIADDTSLTTLQSNSMIELTDQQLDTVQGGYSDICIGCLNLAVVTQLNLSVLSADVYQANYSTIFQNIN